MKKILIIGLTLLVFGGFYNFASAQINFFCQPGSFDAYLCFTNTTQPGQQTTASTVFLILQNIGGFLIAAAGVIVSIVIIVAGLLWVSSGSSPNRLATAKTVFKNGIIGAIILFASGVIINTIILLASNWQQFFV